MGIRMLMLFCLSSFFTSVFSQTAPGGEATSCVQWIRPEAASSTVNGSPVATITASAGLGTVTTTLSASGSVVYRDAALNFNPGIELTAGQMCVVKDAAMTVDATIACVFKTTNASGSSGNWYSDAAIISGEENGGMDDFGMTMVSGAVEWSHDGSDGVLITGGSANDGVAHLALARREQGGSRDNQLYVDSDSTGAVQGGGNQTWGAALDTIFFGAHRGGAGNWDGTYGDIVFYSNDIGENERRNVQSYMALKYGITLNHTYFASGGAAVYDPITFGNEVAGIARDDNTLLHQRISQPASDPTGLILAHGSGYAGVLPTLNAAGTGDFASNDQFLVAGHDNGGPGFTSALSTAGANTRMTRRYKVTDFGAVGTTTLYFDDATFVGFLPAQTYYFVVSTDPIFESSDIFAVMTESGANPGDYFIEYDFPDNSTVYFTIATTNSFTGPGGVTDNLRMWHIGDAGVTPGPSVTTWADQAGNGLDVTNTGATINVTSNPLNFHDHLTSTGAIDQQFGTPANPQFDAQTIAVVGRASGCTNNEGFIGQPGGANGMGIRFNNTGNDELKIGAAGADWTNGGTLVGNGLSAAVVDVTDWTVVMGERTSANVDQMYYGGYFASRACTDYEFAEGVAFADNKITSGGGLPQRVISYLAWKYGITLDNSVGSYHASDFNGTIGTTMFTFDGTYENGVAIIGRDDASNLQQLQSRTSQADSLVTIGKDVIVGSNAAHPSSFSNDRHFVAWANDGGGYSCWSTDEISILGEESLFLRIEREWKLTEPAILDNLIFRVNANNLPALAAVPGATDYYLILDTDNDLSSSATALQMTQIGASNIWEIAVPTTMRFTTTTYFTFATRAAQSVKHPTFCPGDAVSFFGSYLYETNECTRITLSANGGSVIYNLHLDPGNTAISDSEFVAIGAAGECVDELQWTVPANIQPFDYDVIVSRTNCGCHPVNNAGFPCNTTTYPLTGDFVVMDSMQIGGDTLNVVWPKLSYCVGDTNPIPQNLGSAGTFSVIPANPALMPNALTGELMIHSGNVGTHTIQFQTNGLTGCPSIQQWTVKIGINDPNSAIGYNGSPYCTTLGGTQLPSTIVPAVGGQFISQPPGIVFIDSTTGEIDLPNSTPGNYVIDYSSDTVCFTSAQTSIAISFPDTQAFDYPLLDYCINDTAAMPIVTNAAAGGIYEIDATSPVTMVGLDSVTGEINLADTATGTGTIYINFVVNPAITCSDTTRDTITVHPLPPANFTMDTLVCVTDSILQPTFVDPGGIFSNWTGQVVWYNDTTGVINVPATGVGGPFPITYTVDNGQCSDSTNSIVVIFPEDSVNFTYSKAQYCQNEGDPGPVFTVGALGGEFYSQPAGLVMDSLNGVIDLDSSTAGTYDIFYIFQGTICPDTFQYPQQITIQPAADAGFNIGVTTVCGNSDTLWFNTVNDASNSTFSIFYGQTASTAELVRLPPTPVHGINTNLVPPGGPYLIQNMVFDGNGCRDTAFAYLQVLEPDTADFIYNSGAFCIDDVDPFPVFQGNNGGVFWGGPGTVVDSTTGLLSLDSSGLGIHNITYATLGFCSDTATFQVEILPDLSAFFEYPNTQACETDTNIVPLNITNPGLGVFTTDTTGILVDSLSGTIIMDSTVAGEYTITYTVDTAGSCLSFSSVQMNIVAVDTSTYFFYDKSEYCKSDSNPTPTIVGNDSAGTFLTASGLAFADPVLGTISLPLTQPGTHLVRYQLQTICSELFDTTVIVSQWDTAFFSYPTSRICFADTTIFPDSIATPGGFFTAVDIGVPGVLNIDSTTGAINVGQSTESVYEITYTTNSQCAQASTIQVEVFPSPQSADLQIDPGNVICLGTQVSFEGKGENRIEYTIDDSLVSIGADYITTALQDSQVVEAFFENPFGCRDSIEVVMTVFDVPDGTPVEWPDFIRTGETATITVETDLDGTTFSWTASAPDVEEGLVTFEDTTGVTAAPVDSGMTDILQSIINYNQGFRPILVWFEIIANANGCPSNPDSVSIWVYPTDKAIYIPEVMTPNDDGRNDTWLIRYEDGVNPNGYILELYNRSNGGILATIENLDDTWNGGGLPDGVYWWILKDPSGAAVDAGGLTIRRR